MNLTYYLQAIALALFLMGGVGCKPSSSPVGNEEETTTCHEVPNLIEPEAILARLDGGQPTFILDVSPEARFLKEHLPGAQQIWRGDYANTEEFSYGGMKADSLHITELLSERGLNSNDSVFLYDRRGNVDAARFLWILKTYGFERSFLVNGGWEKWKTKGFPTDSMAKQMPAKGNFIFPKAKAPLEPVMEIAHVKNAITDSTWLILDTRSTSEYTGEVQKKGAYRKGRIPTSIHLDWIDMIHNDGDHSFKDCQEILPILEERGIYPDKRIITYCHSGVRSAHMLFVLREIMGYPYVWNYDGSWTEWSYFDELPIET